MQFFAKVSRLVKMVMAAVVVGSALLVVPGGAAHAAPLNDGPNFGVLLGTNKGRGEACSSNQNAPGIYLYSDINYQGRCGYFTPNLPISYFNVDSFNRSVGNDKASSIRIVNSSSTRFSIMFYVDKDYKGDGNTIEHDIPDFRNWRETYTDQYHITTIMFHPDINDSGSSMLVSWY